IYGNKIRQDYVFHFTTGRQISYEPQRPPFEVLLNGDMVITSAKRGSATIPIRVNGNKPIPVSLHKLDPRQMGQVTLVNHPLAEGLAYIERSDYMNTRGVAYGRCRLPPTANAENLLRQWTYTFDKTRPSVALAADGKDLPSGLYWVTMG